MRKFIFVFLFVLLAGCAGGKEAYHYQGAAALSAADTIQQGLQNLAVDVSKSCAGDEFKARFVALDSALASLRVQISSITTAADADMAQLKTEIQKRNISIIGLVAIFLIFGFYGLRKTKL